MRLFESSGIKLRLLLLANLLLSINYLTFYGMSLTNLLVLRSNDNLSVSNISKK